MSTPNFGTPNYNLPIVACGMKREMDEFEYEEVQEEIDRFNRELNHFEVRLDSGYYQGAMLNVSQTNNYWNYEDIDEIEDYDAHYYFGMSAKEVKAEIKSEMEKVKEFFETMAKSENFVKLYKFAQFSNGEAIYKELK